VVRAAEIRFPASLPQNPRIRTSIEKDEKVEPACKQAHSNTLNQTEWQIEAHMKPPRDTNGKEAKHGRSGREEER